MTKTILLLLVSATLGTLLTASTPARATDGSDRTRSAIRELKSARAGHAIVAIREDGSRIVICQFKHLLLEINDTSKDKKWAVVDWNTEDEAHGSLGGSTPSHSGLVSVDHRRLLLTNDLDLDGGNDFVGFTDEGGVEVLMVTTGPRSAPLRVPTTQLESLIKPKHRRTR